MAGPNHRRDPFFALDSVRGSSCKRTETPALGKTQCSGQSLILCMIPGEPRVRLLDARNSQFLFEPPLAVTARAQRPRLTQRIGGVIDVSEICKAVRKCFEIGLPLAVPAPFAQLSSEVGPKLCPRRRIFADVA